MQLPHVRPTMHCIPLVFMLIVSIFTQIFDVCVCVCWGRGGGGGCEISIISQK